MWLYLYHEALLLLQPALVILHLLLLHHQPLLHLSVAVVLERDHWCFKGLHKTPLLSFTNKMRSFQSLCCYLLMAFCVWLQYYEGNTSMFGLHIAVCSGLCWLQESGWVKLPPAPPAPAWPEGCGVGRENNLFLMIVTFGSFCGDFRWYNKKKHKLRLYSWNKYSKPLKVTD